MMRFRLLSIDGGGIRGLIPALVLAEIERLTGRRAHELFDAIAGTSTGGIIALGAAKGIPAQELVELYKQHGATIFRAAWHRKAFYRGATTVKDLFSLDARIPHNAALNDLWDPKYDAENRKQVLGRYFGATRLEEAKTRVFVTSYETSTRMPVFFVHPRDAKQTAYHEATGDCTMLDAAMASSAAPTYFPPHAVPRSQMPLAVKGTDVLSFVDGGIFANNPTGLAHSLLNGGKLDGGDLILSLGTGSMTLPYSFDRIDDWGAVGWALPVIKMMFDGQSEAVALALSSRLPPEQYLRLQAYLSYTPESDSDHLAVDVSDDLDNATAANIRSMEQFAVLLMQRHRRELDAFCEMLAT